MSKLMSSTSEQRAVKDLMPKMTSTMQSTDRRRSSVDSSPTTYEDDCLSCCTDEDEWTPRPSFDDDPGNDCIHIPLDTQQARVPELLVEMSCVTSEVWPIWTPRLSFDEDPGNDKVPELPVEMSCLTSEVWPVNEDLQQPHLGPAEQITQLATINPRILRGKVPPIAGLCANTASTLPPLSDVLPETPTPRSARPLSARMQTLISKYENLAKKVSGTPPGANAGNTKRSFATEHRAVSRMFLKGASDKLASAQEPMCLQSCLQADFQVASSSGRESPIEAISGSSSGEGSEDITRKPSKETAAEEVKGKIMSVEHFFIGDSDDSDLDDSDDDSECVSPTTSAEAGGFDESIVEHIPTLDHSSVEDVSRFPASGRKLHKQFHVDPEIEATDGQDEGWDSTVTRTTRGVEVGTLHMYLPHCRGPAEDDLLEDGCVLHASGGQDAAGDVKGGGKGTPMDKTCGKEARDFQKMPSWPQQNPKFAETESVQLISRQQVASVKDLHQSGRDRQEQMSLALWNCKRQLSELEDSAKPLTIRECLRLFGEMQDLAASALESALARNVPGAMSVFEEINEAIEQLSDLLGKCQEEASKDVMERH